MGGNGGQGLEKPAVILTRTELLAKLAKHGPRAVDVLAAASDRGDLAAATKILAKLLPDLKAVDITQMEAASSRIVIAPRIYIRQGEGRKEVSLPNVNIQIGESKPHVVQELDITPSLKASPPIVEQERRDYKAKRMKSGKYE